MNVFSIAWLRILALAVALPVAILAAVVLSTDRAQSLVAHGPIQSGHDALGCADCHVEAPGSFRQQVQANLRFVLGLRAHPVDFGAIDVNSRTCLDCHARPNDRHPIYRFQEPRFEKAVAEIAATNCLGCHSEHEARRVKADVGTTFCASCHGTLEMRNDPLDVPHVTLVADKNWGSCMTCHDFHGNHPEKAPTLLREAKSADSVAAYLADEPSPYGDKKSYMAKESR